MVSRLSTLLFLYFLAFIYGGGAFYAQSATVYHQVITFDGKEYVGTLQHYQPGELLHLQLKDGEDVFLAADAVKRINTLGEKGEKEKKRLSSTTKKDVVLLNKPLTIQISGSANFGSLQQVDNFFALQRIFGYSSGLVLQHRLGSRFQVGGGIDYFSFSPSNRENAISAFGRLRGWVSNKPKSLFLQLDAGYGLPIASNKARLTAREGGLLFHPAIGYVFKQTTQMPELSIDFGYRITEQERTFLIFNGEQNQINAYRRACLRLGVAL